MQTPLGVMKLTVHPGYRVWGEIGHVVFIHRVPYQVMFEFALLREREEWFASTPMQRVTRNDSVWSLHSGIKDKDGLTYSTSSHRDITETARKHVMSIIPPLFEAWIEKNYMLLGQATPAYHKMKIEEAKNRIGATLKELSALQLDVWELESTFLSRGELSTMQVKLLEDVLSRKFSIRSEEAKS